MSQFFTDYYAARHAAHLKAVSLGLPVAIRREQEYGVNGFTVRLLAWSDSDAVLAERVTPGDWCDCAPGDGCRRKGGTE